MKVEVSSGVTVAIGLAAEVGCTGIIGGSSIATGTCFVDTTGVSAFVYRKANANQ